MISKCFIITSFFTFRCPDTVLLADANRVTTVRLVMPASHSTSNMKASSARKTMFFHSCLVELKIDRWWRLQLPIFDGTGCPKKPLVETSGSATLAAPTPGTLRPTLSTFAPSTSRQRALRWPVAGESTSRPYNPHHYLVMANKYSIAGPNGLTLVLLRWGNESLPASFLCVCVRALKWHQETERRCLSHSVRFFICEQLQVAGEGPETRRQVGWGTAFGELSSWFL